MKDLYAIKSEKIVHWYEKAEEIEANLCLMLIFCQKYSDVDDFYKLLPILKHTYKIADSFYADLIEIRYND
ncbi:hypothetical protein IKQ21_09745 [bacterium]|nr:hypothetical protein [bacterium]